MVAMASQPLPLTLPSSSSSLSSSHYLPTFHYHTPHNGALFPTLRHRRTSTVLSLVVASVGKEDTDLRVSDPQEEEEEDEPTPEDLEYVAQIKRVLQLLKKNRDMLFGEVKLTIMIEDPREIERRRLLGIEEIDGPTREDLANALEEVNQGKIPKDRVTLQKLAEEMAEWPNVEEEAPKKKPTKSLYAKNTDTGIDPQVVAKRLNIDWDSAAEIEDTDTDDERDVPSVLGFGALYLVSAFPVIIEPKISTKETSQKEKQTVIDTQSLRPSLPPSKPRFMSHSLPNSANSSPLFTSTLVKRKAKVGVVEAPCQPINLTALKNQHPPLQKIHLRKTKSYGEEGRASAAFDEFDVWLSKPNVVEHYNMYHHQQQQQHHISKTETFKESPKFKDFLETNEDEGFKCSALCLFLPGFGKTKAVKTKKEGSEMELGVISRTVSLEKFECASWASSTLFNEIDIERESSNSYFDLPMELIKCSMNDVHAPVTSAFVFQKEGKGILKNGSSGRKSDISPQQVRFSISSSRKAREDLNAYLEAQSA